MFCKISYINHIGLSLLAMLLVMIVPAGCSDDLDNGLASGDEAGYITLNLRNVKGSRATDDANNEDRLERAVVCLYPNGAVAATTPSYVEYFDLTANETATVKIKLSKTLASALFGDGNGTCTAYVVANLPADAPAITTSTPLADISKFTIYSDFASMQPQTSFVMDGTGNVNRSGYGTAEDKATGTIELRRAASRISLAVEVADRYTDAQNNVWTPEPSNMSVLITNGVNRSQVESSTYTPADGDYYATTTAAENPDHRQRGFSGPVSGEKYNYQLASPFYTFPNKWSENETETPMTYMTLMLPWRNETTGTVRTCFYMVPVVKGNELIRNVAYSVKLSVNVLGSFTPDKPLPLTDLSYYAVDWGSLDVDVNLNESRYLVVDRNNYTIDNERSISIPVYTSHETIVTSVKATYYRYNTSAQGQEVPVEITQQQYQNTVDRGNGKIYDAVMDTTHYTDGRFLINLNLDHELKVWDPYNSSNDRVQLELISKRQNGNSWSYTYPSDIPGNITRINYYQKTDVDAFSKYKFEITIQHKDKFESTDPNEKETFKEVLTIMQYPAVYVEAYGGYRWTGSNVTGTTGNVFVNGVSNESDEYWNYIFGLQTSNNANPNNTIITITQLNEGQKYIIGDPRETTPTDLTRILSFSVRTGGSLLNPTYEEVEFNSNSQYATAPNYAWISAPGIDDLNTPRKLTNYYPTGGEGYERYIAPKLRLASSFGICQSTNTLAEDKLRCAGYQELSRPAGRWRIPTVAEIEYIMKLSNEKKIPTTFNEGSDYMSAQGVVNSNETNADGTFKVKKTTTQAAVRCVYDEWYWGADTIKPISGTSGTRNERYQFTWGDRPRKTTN